ncbi:MAG: thioredoxin family protein [Chloroflexota bacterium]
MEIKILGSCCGNCDKLMATVQQLIAEKKLSATVQKVSDLREIMSYGVMGTPGLVVNGKVVSAGRVPSKEEIATLLEAARG